MNSNNLRIFSYLPNPRLFKSSITARICDVEIEIRGAKPNELPGWLWDFDAKPLDEISLEDVKKNSRDPSKGFENKLVKTDSFLRAHPFGSVPAAFSPDGTVGVFESNSIMRAVARLGNNETDIYGSDPFSASRIDSFLDSSLIFARDSQIYLLSLMKGGLRDYVYNSVKTATNDWLKGIDKALDDTNFIASNKLSLADICFVCEIALLKNEILYENIVEELGETLLTGNEVRKRFSRAWSHYEGLCSHPAFEPDLGPYLEKLTLKSQKT